MGLRSGLKRWAEKAKVGLNTAAEHASGLFRNRIFAGVLAGTAAFGAASEAQAQSPTPTVKAQANQGNADFNPGLGYKLSEATRPAVGEALAKGGGYAGPIIINEVAPSPTKTIGQGAYAINIPIPQVADQPATVLASSETTRDREDFLAAIEEAEVKIDQKMTKKPKGHRHTRPKDVRIDKEDSKGSSGSSIQPEDVQLATSDDELNDNLLDGLFTAPDSMQEPSIPPVSTSFDLDQWLPTQSPKAPVIDRGPVRVTVESLIRTNNASVILEACRKADEADELVVLESGDDAAPIHESPDTGDVMEIDVDDEDFQFVECSKISEIATQLNKMPPPLPAIEKPEKSSAPSDNRSIIAALLASGVLISGATLISLARSRRREEGDILEENKGGDDGKKNQKSETDPMARASTSPDLSMPIIPKLIKPCTALTQSQDEIVIPPLTLPNLIDDPELKQSTEEVDGIASELKSAIESLAEINSAIAELKDQADELDINTDHFWGASIEATILNSIKVTIDSYHTDKESPINIMVLNQLYKDHYENLQESLKKAEASLEGLNRAIQ